MSNNGAHPSYDVGTMSIRNGSSQSLLQKHLLAVKLHLQEAGWGSKTAYTA